MSAILSVADRIKRAKRMQQAVELATHPDPSVRVSAYAAAKKYQVSQSAISQNRAYRLWKNNQKEGRKHA